MDVGTILAEFYRPFDTHTRDKRFFCVWAFPNENRLYAYLNTEKRGNV